MSADFKDEAEVKEYIKNLGSEYRYGCYNEKKPEVCHLLGDYLEAVSKDYHKAAKVYKSNCDDYSFGKSCRKTASYILAGKGGLGSPDDKSKAVGYYEKGCNLGDGESCFRSGVLHILTAKTASEACSTSPSFLKGVERLRSCCDGGVGEGCHHLSAVFMGGDNKEWPADMRLAFKYAVEACRLGVAPACANVSLMYRRGDGVAANPDLSQEYRCRAQQLQRELQAKRQFLFQQGLPPV